MSPDKIRSDMERRGERNAFRSLDEGEFRPLTISDDLRKIFRTRAAEIGQADPFEAARDVIDRIREQLSVATLRGDLFPDIENPLDTSMVEGITDFVANAALPNINAGFLGQGNVTVPNNTGLVYNENEPLAKRIDTIAKVDSLI